MYKQKVTAWYSVSRQFEVFGIKEFTNLRHTGILRGKNMGMLESPPPPLQHNPPPWLGLIIPLAIENPYLNPTAGKAFHTGIDKITGK